ncbi:MAG: HAMP domain-containing protein [Phycisphaeraceae bacterium]|nr:MAG: HAMP domain-containing protein [Phycisphaeraceae bacterium]
MPRFLASAPPWLRIGLLAGVAVLLIQAFAAISFLAIFGPSSELITATAILTLLSAAGGFAIGAAITARGTRRLTEITEGARRFSRGDLRHRIPTSAEGELAALATALNDMAQLLSSQLNQLRAQRNEQEGILRSMEGGVLAIDAEFRVLRVNRVAQRMLGLTDTQVRGKTLHEVVRDTGLQRFAADAVADPSRRAAEFHLTVPTRGDIIVRATSGALLDAEDEPIGAIILLSDVSQLKRLESMRSDFAANVSHELRTPITNIKGYVETLIDTDLSNPDLSMNFLRVIARNADRLGAIVDDMLALTNLERTDGQILPTAPTPLWMLLDSVRLQLDPEARSKRIRLALDVPKDLRAKVNARLAEQAIVNLVANAIKYSPPETVVTMSARAAPEALEDGVPAIEIAIADQGPGIAPEHLPRIFERFYRVDKARSREQGGTGLGLSIVKHIALVHAGAVSADSTLGEGSTFRLTLPAAIPPPIPSIPEHAASP